MEQGAPQPRQHSAAGNKRQLSIVFGFTALYLVVEVVGGLVTGSLALLADAGHMLTDVGGLGLALFAIRLAERPATPARTYGYYRVETLSAVANAVVLIGISADILYEAYRRFLEPPAVESLGMIGVASVGLLVNIAGNTAPQTGLVRKSEPARRVLCSIAPAPAPRYSGRTAHCFCPVLQPSGGETPNVVSLKEPVMEFSTNRRRSSWSVSTGTKKGLGLHGHEFRSRTAIFRVVG